MSCKRSPDIAQNIHILVINGRVIFEYIRFLYRYLKDIWPIFDIDLNYIYKTTYGSQSAII